ncbi:hypothetical protein CAPTEDRAFT_222739 [Capitella teleta]|uniref:C3H1-type domain-containing protein n=1 Tax=Capitella teleta TaxID=283909 RepID=R7UQ21_CAPTE|nr:hypothetical protein CAPTEDRAFT_222739 [Capitella teleta]|eukprot:ELU08203.1 hypothetical protein CAPTEDRAFT_222739 [Capitella teleta]
MPDTKIENLDALKIWLIKELTPICDADPSTLAKYVVALAKKDLPDNELKDLCTRELEVFMQDKTTGFVESLFKAFGNKSYMEFAPKTIPPLLPIVTPVRQEIPPADASNNNGQIIIKMPSPHRPTSPDRSRTTSGSELKDLRRRSKSRSRSPRRREDVSRGGDLRQRLTDRRRFEPTDRPRSRYPRYDNHRRRSPGGRRSPIRRRSPQGRGRSPGRRRSPFGRGHQKSRSRSRSRSRPRSWSRPRSPRSPKARSPSTSLSGSSTSPRRRKSPGSRSSTPLGEFSLDRKVNQPLVTPAPVVTQNRGPSRPRCRDYDEKGFCMRGDLCPFDHGADPVVVEDVHLSNVLKLQGGIRGPAPRGALIPVNRPPPPPPGPGGPRQGAPPPPHPNMPGAPSEPYQPEPYHPHAPNAPPPSWQDPSKDPTASMIEMGGPPDLPETSNSSEVPSQVVPAVHRRTVVSNRHHPHPYRGRGRGGYNKRGGFNIYDRLGPKKYNDNATLEVQKIPSEMNTIAKLNEHFSQFGEIINLQICFRGDPQAAAITFSTNAQANSAYRSTEPIFNNRFIKLFWHRKEEAGAAGDDSQPPPPPPPPAPPKEVVIPPPHKLQLNNKAPVDTVTVSASGAVSALKADASKLLEAAEPVVREPAPPQALTLNNRVNDPKTAIKKKLEIQKKKQMLVEKQIEQQKLLLKKLENKNLSSADKAMVVKTIKTLAGNVDRLRREMSESNNEVTEAIAVSKKSAEVQKEKTAEVEAQFASKQQAQKAILDTELDLMSKQYKGADISQLRQKVHDLKREVASLAPGSRGRGGRGRGSFSRGGRGYGFARGGMRSLDKRPKEILVTGFVLEEKDDVLNHIQGLADVEKSVFDEEVPSLLLTFLSRTAAEKVFKDGVQFGEKVLTFNWQPQSLVLSTPKAVAAPVIVQTSPELDHNEAPSLAVAKETVEAVAAVMAEPDLEDVDEDVLLGLDEEDEEHDEPSSWKR